MAMTRFEIPVVAAEFDDLRDRLARTRWPGAFPAPPWAAGTDRSTLERLIARWADGYDWPGQVAQLNQLDHRIADVDGVPVHFVYFPAEQPTARLPLILTHGWPSTFLELLPLADRLARPSRFGQPSAQARSVVVPSLPGFAFSPPRTTLPAEPATHELWHVLMSRILDFARYGAHGGDLGAGVTTRLAAAHPNAVAGIHLLAPARPDHVDDETLTEEERRFLRADAAWDEEEGAYAHLQSTRPVTLSYGLADSPAGLLAWIVEKYRSWSDSRGELSSRFSDDFILTQATIYWLTNTIASSFQPYFEYRTDRQPIGRVTVPAGFAQFPCDLGVPPRSWLDRVYNVRRYTAMPRGGHFAAYEEPDLLAADINAFFADVESSAADQTSCRRDG